MEIEAEYRRIKALFEGIDEKQLALVDGAIREAARLKVELDGLHEIVRENGLLKVNPKNHAQQKELPVSRLIVRARANYLNYIAKLSAILGRNLDEEDDTLEEEYA